MNHVVSTDVDMHTRFIISVVLDFITGEVHLQKINHSPVGFASWTLSFDSPQESKPSHRS